MSLRKFMHPRNKYKVEPNFKELAEIYPEFKQHLVTDLTGKLKFNFKNPESLRVLAQVLLKHDFGLSVDIPPSKLVPALPLRLNYILWIEDLLNHSKISDVHGLDVGTGAVAIYPLLCAKTLGWRMTGTEIDPSSITSAVATVKQNNLDNLIQISPAEKATVFKAAIDRGNSYDFSMCNPPFFDADKMDDRKVKKMAPRNATTGSEGELVTEGGERSFVLKMIDESLEIKEKIKIYTTMIGHKSSLGFFKRKFRERGIENFTWTEFCQGHTKRWGIAWGFLDRDKIDLKSAPFIRTRSEVRRGGEEAFGVEVVVPGEGEYSEGVPRVAERVKGWMKELQIQIEELKVEDEDLDVWTCQLRATEDSWSHARRKRRMALRLQRDPKRARPDPSDDPPSRNPLPTAPQGSSDPQDHSSSTELFLEATLAIGEVSEHPEDSETPENSSESPEPPKTKISMILVGGTGGKNALETFRQFLINKLGIRGYFQSQNKSRSPRKKKKKRNCSEIDTKK
ncbi:U6 small nuclear RNA (adenine-(43)-N(6))-methyltransferase [Diachasma alloeum]|uniref:U6 small nuclear RNA (adenine-(43)-N(6))-methyltransferase n=1 Tax=Diachasma alloeum TaxID=454923 RepID=UPI000738359E|nr:U6 small nuclear RNA (adenine-(43)-N(6))-methyltransferase [Diachasma alloeum]